MSGSRVVARLSGLDVDVSFEGAARAAATFAGVWGASAARRYTPPLRTMSVEVRASAARGYEITVDGAPHLSTFDERLVCPRIELQLYEAFLASELQARRTVLHAAAVTGPGRCYVFAGVSGSGKSALSRAALRAGFRYLGDEHVITEGSSLWGVPRSVHLDLEPASSEPAAWHAGSERELYQFPGADGTLLRLPYVPIGPEQLALHAAPLGEVVLVALRRGTEDRIAPLSASQRLQLLEGAHFVRSAALAKLALVTRAYQVSWSDPDAAFAALDALVAPNAQVG